jgi:hypothetical protein
MPIISEFYGIRIIMNYKDFGHHNHPHVHVDYQEFKAVFAIPEGEILAGRLPRRQTRFVRNWIAEHEQELMDDWKRAVVQETLLPIAGYKR